MWCCRVVGGLDRCGAAVRWVGLDWCGAVMKWAGLDWCGATVKWAGLRAVSSLTMVKWPLQVAGLYIRCPYILSFAPKSLCTNH